MTIEEAKEQLWELIHDRESFIVGDNDEEIYRKDIEALKKALELFEKQIPKKHRCPSCDGHDIEDVFIEKINFCPFCGQALDWESDNDD